MVLATWHFAMQKYIISQTSNILRHWLLFFKDCLQQKCRNLFTWIKGLLSFSRRAPKSSKLIQKVLSPVWTIFIVCMRCSTVVDTWPWDWGFISRTVGVINYSVTKAGMSQAHEWCPGNSLPQALETSFSTVGMLFGYVIITILSDLNAFAIYKYHRDVVFHPVLRESQMLLWLLNLFVISPFQNGGRRKTCG